MAYTLDINVISSKTGGNDTVAYDRETTICRIQQTIEEVLSERIPSGLIASAKIKVTKPAGAVRRATRGMSGVRVTSIRIRIAIGSWEDMCRDVLIRACQDAMPAAVTTNVPADHLCSLVIAFKDGTRASDEVRPSSS